MKNRYLVLLLTCCSLVVDAQSAEAEKPDSLDLFDEDTEQNQAGWDQLSVSLGAMWLQADGEFDVGLPTGKTVTVLDLDRVGLDDKDTSYWLTVKWRSRNSNWGAWFGSWSYDAAGYRIWEDELKFGDDVIVPVGAGVATELTADWYILEATYSFIQNDSVDLGIGAGIHAVDLGATMKGSVRFGENQREEINESLDALAPLPNLIGFLHWKLGERWSGIIRYGWFGLSYDKYDGQMTNLHTLVRYNLNKRWAFEGGYQFVKLHLDIDEARHTKMFDIGFKGPIAVLRFNF